MSDKLSCNQNAMCKCFNNASCVGTYIYVDKPSHAWLKIQVVKFIFHENLLNENFSTGNRRFSPDSFDIVICVLAMKKLKMLKAYYFKKVGLVDLSQFEFLVIKIQI